MNGIVSAEHATSCYGKPDRGASRFTIKYRSHNQSVELGGQPTNCRRTTNHRIIRNHSMLRRAPRQAQQQQPITWTPQQSIRHWEQTLLQHHEELWQQHQAWCRHRTVLKHQDSRAARDQLAIRLSFGRIHAQFHDCVGRTGSCVSGWKAIITVSERTRITLWSSRSSSFHNTSSSLSIKLKSTPGN